VLERLIIHLRRVFQFEAPIAIGMMMCQSEDEECSPDQIPLLTGHYSSLINSLEWPQSIFGYTLILHSQITFRENLLPQFHHCLIQ